VRELRTVAIRFLARLRTHERLVQLNSRVYHTITLHIVSTPTWDIFGP